MSTLYRRLCPLVVALVLSACGGGGGDNASAGVADDGPVLDGGVVKGPVLGATVCVYQLASGVKSTQLALTLPFGAAGALVNGCYVTPATGSYNFRLPRGSSGDVLIESTGGTFCSNEVQVANGACAGGTLINLGAAVMTSAATLPASGGSSTIYTTPLTTAAVNAAAGATFTAARFNAQFATLAGQVMGNASITPSTPPTTTTQAYLTQVSTYLQGGGSLTNAVNSLAQGTTTFTVGASLPAMAPLGSGATYTMVYASSTIGLDIRPVTATFAPDNALAGYDASAQEALTIGSMRNSERAGSAQLQIGRWNDGQFGGTYYSTVNATNTLALSANQGFHYALANVPASLPCSGTSTYTLDDATHPTRNDGSGLPGLLDSLTVSVGFSGAGPHSFQVTGALAIDSTPVSFSGSFTATPGPRKAFGVGTLAVSGGLSNMSGYGVFAGPDAGELGVVLSGAAPGGTTAQSLRMAARLVRSSTTAASCP